MERGWCRVRMTRHCEFRMQKQAPIFSHHCWATQIGSSRSPSPQMGRGCCCIPMTRRFFGTLNLHPSFLLHLQTVSSHGGRLHHSCHFVPQFLVMVGLLIHMVERCCGFQ